MVGCLYRLASATFVAAALAGCASAPPVRLGGSSRAGVTSPRFENPELRMQCVPYARYRSGVALYGDANTWWTQAAGRYERSSLPHPGSVIVLAGYSQDGRNHVGVVSAMVSAREIRIDHANWLDDGGIYLSDPVADVSPDNDWSEVRVWNPRVQAWGQREYRVQGFIGPDRQSRDSVASLY